MNSTASARVIDTDLVVIGSGGAGLTAAVVAAVEGLRVLVLEKTDLIGGTTAVSGGTVWIPNNHYSASVGVDDSLEEARAYVEACVADAGDPTHKPVIAEVGSEAVRYLDRHAGVRFLPMPGGGGSMDYRPWLPGAKIGGRGLTSPETPTGPLGDWATRLRLTSTSEWLIDSREYYTERMHLDPPGMMRPGASLFEPPAEDAESRIPASLGRGAALVAQLLRGALEHGVEFALQTRATALLVSEGRVIGVEASDGGGDIRISAAAGVVVATGGYSHDAALRKLWMSRRIEHSCELASNSGDGPLMGMAVGAQTAGLGDAWWMPHVPLGEENAIVNTAGSREDRCLPHTIIVNGAGRRFMNESVNYHDVGEYFDSVVGGFHRNWPAWMIFDQQGAEKYAMLDWKVQSGRGGAVDWMHSADTIAGLADEIGVDQSALIATVNRFNGFAEAGVDDDFHRGETPWDLAWGDPANTPNPSLGTIARGPFHAVRMHAGTISTRGGLRVDDHGRVLSAGSGAPIPGLYAAGNCSNGGPASSYPGPGATLGAAVSFAYRIGIEAARTMREPAA